MLLNKWASLYHHSGIVFTTDHDSQIRPSLWIKKDSSSFLWGHCYTLLNNPILRLLIRNNSQVMLRINSKACETGGSEQIICFGERSNSLPNYKCFVSCSWWTCFAVLGKTPLRSEWSTELWGLWTTGCINERSIISYNIFQVLLLSPAYMLLCSYSWDIHIQSIYYTSFHFP